jgi:hypothetical protein
MEPLTFMSAHLIVMFSEALAGLAVLLSIRHQDAAAEPSAIAMQVELAALWQLGYVLSEPLLLSAELFLATSKVAGVLAGGALAFIGCAAAALTYSVTLSLREDSQPQWLRKAVALAIVVAAGMAVTIGYGDPSVAQGVGIAFYLVGRVPLGLLWVGVALGSPCSCGEAIALTAAVKCAGVGCGLFLLSLVMAGVDPDHKQWMILGWIMLPSGAHCYTHTLLVHDNTACTTEISNYDDVALRTV